MRLAGAALRLTIFVGDCDQWHHKPLFTEIVHRLVIIDPVEVIRYVGRDRTPVR